MQQPDCRDPCCQGIRNQDWTAEEAALLHDAMQENVQLDREDTVKDGVMNTVPVREASNDDADVMCGGRPGILFNVKTKRESGPGHSLNKEPRNAPAIAEAPQSQDTVREQNSMDEEKKSKVNVLHNQFFDYEDLMPELVKCDDPLVPGAEARARRRRRLQTAKESEVPSVSSLKSLSGETPSQAQEHFPSLGTAVRAPEKHRMPRADFKRCTRWSMRSIRAENKARQEILKPLIEKRHPPSLKPPSSTVAPP